MDTFALESKIQAITVCKDIARNMGTSFYEHVEDVAEICLSKLMRDRIAMTVRAQSSKLMRFCVASCEDHPERQRALFIMSYMVLMEELDFYVPKNNFDAINKVLKEIHKHLRCLKHLKEKNLTIFTNDDAATLMTRLAEVCKLITEDKDTRKAKIGELAKKLDEEELEYFEEDLESVDKGLHHVMEIVGAVL